MIEVLASFALAVGVLCAICGGLAALLILADGYFNDYGVCEIRINDDAEKCLKIEGGMSLLSALGSRKIFIPSACGGRGSCGLCKLRVTEGAGPLLPTETPHLTPGEQKNATRLSCQLKVRGDMAIEIPESLFKIKEYQARCEKVEKLTHDIRRLRFKLLDPETISFTPGQYIQLECPPYRLTSEPVYRAYSIATDPGRNHIVELVVRLVPDGICTTWIFEELREGDQVKLNGPYGDFRLDTESRNEMIFIAGGSGMAPFLSILKQMEQAGDERKCRYFFGALTKRDLFCLEEMRELEGALADFKFIPALSQPADDDQWEGETGLITEVVARHYRECSSQQAYLCGSPGMIDACIKVLQERKMPETAIFYDKFA